VADLTDAGDQRVGFPPNDSRRVVQVRRHRVGLIGATSILVVAAVVVVFTLIHDAGRASAKVPPRPTLRISPHLVRTLNGRVATVDVAYSPNGETLVTANSYGGITYGTSPPGTGLLPLS